MAAPESGRRELAGWKEIADYLRMNVRTAQKWEAEKGLPVRRYPGEKGRVYAYADEIDAWKEGHGPANDRLWGRWKMLLAGTALAAGVVAAGLLLRPGQPPADYRVEPNHFVALDGQGKELWRCRLPQAAHWTTYQHPELRAQQVSFLDLDGDSRVETLFKLLAAPPLEYAVALLCFSQDGRLKWEFRPGRKVATATQTFSEHYRLSQFTTLSLPGRKGKYVVVTSCHDWSWPNQIVLLSPEGKIAGEYWHSGHLLALGIADVDGDGVEEILAGDVSNARRRAVLVVLDPRRLYGASREPEGDPHQLQGFATGAEKRIIYFPRTCITEATSQPYDHIQSIKVAGTSIDVVVIQGHSRSADTYLIYRFDRELNLLGVTPPDVLGARHRELERAGKLDHALGPRDFEQWKQIEVIQR